MVQKNCKVCGQEYSVKPSRHNRKGNKKAKYCSLKCKYIGTRTKRTIKCDWCHKSYSQYKSIIEKSNLHFCSNICKYRHQKGNRHPQWTGKSFNNGYKTIKIDGQYKFEHRLIIEKHLGRFLKSEEIIHHLNGIKTDNRIENLSIVCRKTHESSTYIKSLQKRIRELEKQNLNDPGQS